MKKEREELLFFGVQFELIFGHPCFSRLFLNQPVQFVCVFHLALHAHLSVNSSAGVRTDSPTRK